ncbi:MAG TPA: DUF2784 domain-containing protein [Bryobacteraceae bacterium]|jgi:hypothetical protein|nr:DUF2784 domain-containing protein [Bryobacteraceae bacterium]
MNVLASAVLTIHLVWILWVIFGAFWTRGRPLLAAFHILSLLWGIVVEVSPLPCPLTIAEQFFEQKAGAAAYHGAFVSHFLDRLVYPDIPEATLVGMGLAVCGINLGVYIWRFRKVRERPA